MPPVSTPKVLSAAASDPLNARLLRECRQLSVEDAAGIRWSATNYPGGYTSYNSLARMHQMSPTFAALEKRIDAHVRAFARTLDFDLAGRKLAMTDCWVNVMTRQVVHGLHLHPLASLERHVLRAHAARLLGTQVRRSEARSLHGVAAAQGARAP